MKDALSVLLVCLFLLLSSPTLADTSGPVNVNTADAASLSSLKGIGPSRAEAIIEYREANGPFRSLHELAQVRGIGERTIEENMDRLTIE